MPKLRRHRRDRRARAPKRRQYRNLVKFIPAADSDFAYTAGGFAGHIARFREECNISAEDSAEISRVVKAYRDALSKALHKFTRTQQTILLKNEARKKAEEIVGKFADTIRADKSVKSFHKKMLRIKERPAKLQKRKCPQHPPKLTFAGPGDGVDGVHVLKYCQSDDYRVILSSGTYGMNRKAKPDHAARLELYVELIPLGEAIPKHPYERMMTGRGSWPLHLGAFTKTPIEAEYPVPAQPSVCVYWARWSDATGGMSRWSRPCVSSIVGYTPGTTGRTLPGAQIVPAVAGEIAGGSESEIRVRQGSGLALPSGQIGAQMPAQLPAAHFIAAQQMRCLIVKLPAEPAYEDVETEAEGEDRLRPPTGVGGLWGR